MSHRHVWQPGKPNSKRTILALHGTGGNEKSLVELVHSLDPEAAILSPRGNVMEGTAPRFFRRLAEGVFDEQDLIIRTNELADFVIESSKSYDFDLSETVAIGYSNGANIAASMLLLRPETLGSAVLLRSMVPLSPPTAPDLTHKRILMLTGEFDPILPLESAHTLKSMFRTYGAQVTFELLRSGHELTRRDLELTQSWLQAS